MGAYPMLRLPSTLLNRQCTGQGAVAFSRSLAGQPPQHSGWRARTAATTRPARTDARGHARLRQGGAERARRTWAERGAGEQRAAAEIKASCPSHSPSAHEALTTRVPLSGDCSFHQHDASPPAARSLRLRLLQRPAA
jgi:hypothetical protein